MSKAVIKYYVRTRPHEIKSGQPIDAGAAKAWVECLNKEHPELYHWVEPVPEKDAKNG